MSLTATEGNPRIEKLISNSLVARGKPFGLAPARRIGDFGEPTKRRSDVPNWEEILADAPAPFGLYRGFTELGPRRHDLWSNVLFAIHSGPQVGFSRAFSRAVPPPPPDRELSSVNCPPKPEIAALSARMPRKSLLEARHYSALTNFIRPRQLIDRH